MGTQLKGGFRFEAFGEVSLSGAGGDVQNTPVFKARWKVSFPTAETIAKQIRLGGFVMGLGIQDSGAAGVVLAIARSSDNGATWTNVVSTNFSGASFALGEGSLADLPLMPAGVTDVAIVLFADNGTTDGRIKEYAAEFEVFLPQGYQLSKVG